MPFSKRLFTREYAANEGPIFPRELSGLERAAVENA